MTNEKAYERLNEILMKISKNEYPGICFLIEINMDDVREGYEDVFSLASSLHDADGDKELPGCVAELLFEVYEEEMKTGNADAACNIGSLYYTGRGGAQDYSKAMTYYHIAAKGGCRQAQENLGYCYYYGRDTAVDYEKAFQYFALGAFDGNIRSLYKIGDMYRNGYYVEKNVVEAFLIYTRCAETMTKEESPLVGGDVMMRLGDCYFEGIGTKEDYRLALQYYISAEQMFYDRLMDGDFLIKPCYEKVKRRQAETREILESKLPDFSWTK